MNVSFSSKYTLYMYEINYKKYLTQQCGFK